MNRPSNRTSLLTLALLALALLALTGCATTAIGYEPDTSEAERDRLHRTTPRPVVDARDVFVGHTEVAEIPLPPADLLAWIVQVPLERVLLGTDDLAAVARTEPLTDGWGQPGDRRRVVLEDGNTALEELVDYVPGSHFDYVVWNFTNEAGSATGYAAAQFAVEEIPGGTRLSWTYRFQEQDWLTGAFLRRYVATTYRAYMERCMRAIIDESQRDLGA